MPRSKLRGIARSATAIPEGGAAIVSMVTPMGLCVGFKRWMRKDGVVAYRVYGYRRGDSCLRKPIGNLDELAGLSEDALRAKLQAAFPLKTSPVAKVSLDEDDQAIKGWGDYA
jgi:hypothetical protein